MLLVQVKSKSSMEASLLKMDPPLASERQLQETEPQQLSRHKVTYWFTLTSS